MSSTSDATGEGPKGSGASWTVLGAGSILPREGYGCAGYALRTSAGGPVTLFDCGPGTLRALAPAGIELGEVRRVVLSHYHPDHCLDLFALFFARRNPGFRPAPSMELIAPDGLAKVLGGGRAAFGRWVEPEDCSILELGDTAKDGWAGEFDGIRLSCVGTGHTPHALAWRADLADGSSVCFTGDTPESKAVADLARDVELFTAECSHLDGEGVAGHLTPTSAARMAVRAECRRLLLSHFYPGVEPERAREQASATFPGTIELARDGSVHPLGSAPG